MSQLPQPLQAFPTPEFLRIAKYRLRTAILTLCGEIASQFSSGNDLTTTYGVYSSDMVGGSDTSGLQLVIQVWNDGIGPVGTDPGEAGDVFVQVNVVGVIHPDITTAETFAWAQFTADQPNNLNLNSGMVNLGDILKVQTFLEAMVSKYGGTFTVPSNAQVVLKSQLS